NLGVVLKAAGKLREAEKAYLTAIECNPAFAAAHNNLGNLYRDEGRYGDAERYYAAAVAANKDYSDAWYGLASVLHRQGKLPQAIVAFERTLAITPDRPEIICDLAMCKLAQDDTAAARRLMEKAVELAPSSHLTHGNLGAVHLRTARLVEAEYH